MLACYIQQPVWRHCIKFGSLAHGYHDKNALVQENVGQKASWI